MHALKVVVAGTLRDAVQLQLASHAATYPVSVGTADANVAETSAAAHLCIAAGELDPGERWAVDVVLENGQPR